MKKLFVFLLGVLSALLLVWVAGSFVAANHESPSDELRVGARSEGGNPTQRGATRGGPAVPGSGAVLTGIEVSGPSSSTRISVTTERVVEVGLQPSGNPAEPAPGAHALVELAEEKPPKALSSATSAEAAHAELVISTGSSHPSISGTVRLEGEGRVFRRFPESRDRLCAAKAALLLTSQQGLPDALVELTYEAARDAPSVAATPVAVAGLRACSVSPPIAVGSAVLVRNPEGRDHNLKAASRDVFIRGAGDVTIPIERAWDPISIACDIHPSERMNVLRPRDGRTAVVTDEKGRFRFEGLPSGRYHLRAWFPAFGWTPPQNVKFDGKDESVTFRFSPNVPEDSQSPEFEVFPKRKSKW